MGLGQDITELTRSRTELAHERDNLELKVEERTLKLRESLERIEETNLRLDEVSRHKSRFLSSMSHELRTPLNAILGFADLLHGQFFGDLNEKQLVYVGHIDNSGKHLLELINDLLDMAKIDAGAMELELEEIPTDELTEAVVSMMSTQFRKKQLRVETILDPALPVVSVDPRKCKQIIINLLSNAIKYTTEKGKIELRVSLHGESKMKVEISDTGVGIEPDELDKIFSEFHQADHVRDEQLGGTGIGLALTRRLVELHGGELGVESEVGKGSTFWFILPLRKLRNDRSITGEGAAEPAKSTPTAHRILVAEDNEVNLSMILDMLSVHGHTVIVARNGQEAVELAQTFKPELIFMDVKMPIMDGLEATRCIRAIPGFEDTPIIALTASTGSKAQELQVASGCTEHLPKPIQSKELFEVLRRYLGK